MLHLMKSRSIIMDISIDEGGCTETSRPTTHDHPTFVEEGIIHYCVPNMPGVVARSSTHSFVNSALPFILEMTDHGVEAAIDQNPAIEKGTNTRHGNIMHLSSFAQLLQED
jgi:alanine dehydrogenase